MKEAAPNKYSIISRILRPQANVRYHRTINRNGNASSLKVRRVATAPFRVPQILASFSRHRKPNQPTATITIGCSPYFSVLEEELWSSLAALARSRVRWMRPRRSKAVRRSKELQKSASPEFRLGSVTVFQQRSVEGPLYHQIAVAAAAVPKMPALCQLLTLALHHRPWTGDPDATPRAMPTSAARIS
jgi:hypothetical protein